MDDRLARLLLEDNIIARVKTDAARISLLEKLAVQASVIQLTINQLVQQAPAGVDKSVQYNDGGLFGGDANFTWDKTGRILTFIGTGGNATITGVADGDSEGIELLGGDASVVDAPGGFAQITGGFGNGAGTGGAAALEGGDGGVTGNGGVALLHGGPSGGTSGDGGNVEIEGGVSQTSGDGGDITITPGAGAGAGGDGIVTINGDVHFENDNMIWDKTAQTLTMIGSGAANIQGTESTGLLLFGGAAVTADTAGGDIAILGGTGDGIGNGGTAGVVGGLPGQTGNSGNVDIHTPNGGNEGGNAGDISLTGGDGVGGYNGDGGSITLTPGTGAGTGVDGIVSINNGDLHILGTGATGLVLYDATLAAYYRITLDNGVFIITAV